MSYSFKGGPWQRMLLRIAAGQAGMRSSGRLRPSARYMHLSIDRYKTHRDRERQKGGFDRVRRSSLIISISISIFIQDHVCHD